MCGRSETGHLRRYLGRLPISYHRGYVDRVGSFAGFREFAGIIGVYLLALEHRAVGFALLQIGFLKYRELREFWHLGDVGRPEARGQSAGVLVGADNGIAVDARPGLCC